LIEINIANGSYTVIGPVTVDAGHTWTSAKFDPASGTFYATSTNITVSSLYTINITNGTTTRIATITNMPAIIGMAIQAATGQMYGYDIVGDNFYGIDKVTGTGTLIGPIGFNANLAQDMAFDRQSGILYMAAYSTAFGQLRTVNLATGATTLIGPLGVGDHLIDPFSVQGSFGPSANWLEIAPTSGPIALSDSVLFTARFDATSPVVFNDPGNYFGRVEINTVGAPVPDTLRLPARMFVVPSVGADLVVIPDTMDIGNVEIGVTDSSKSVLVKNIGQATLNVTNVTFTGASGFSSNLASFSLTSLDTVRIKVRFSAVAPGGVRTARMNFTSNDPTPGSVGLRAVSVGVSHISVAPDTFGYTLPSSNDTTRSTFRIRNTGTDTLRFNINEGLAAPTASILRSVTQQAALTRNKGVENPNPGEGTPNGAGGPDAFGYRWIDSDEPGGPQFAWVDISTIGTLVTFPSTDDAFVTVSLPFTFPFYGVDQSSINIVTNGFMNFGPTSSSFSNTAIPTTATPNNAIYPFWDDLNFATGGTVHYYHDVATGRFIVQYTNAPHFGSGGPYTFQAILKPNGDMLFQYLTMSDPVNSATIGVENSGGTIGLQVVFDAAYMHNNLAILITKDILPWMSPGVTNGIIAPGDSQSVELRIHPAGLQNGNYTGRLTITGNTPDVASVRVGLTVTGGVAGVTVTSPNGGEVWSRGNTYSITWTQNNVDTVRIEYSVSGNGGPWRPITSGVPARPNIGKHPKLDTRWIEGGTWIEALGAFSWLIPDTVAPSANCYVRISQKSNAAISDVSNAAFTITSTVPGDTSWAAQTSGTTATLFAVKAVDANVAWSAGAGGVVRRTTNGGVNWTSAGSVGVDVYTITALDGNTAFVASSPATGLAKIWKTTNGGTTWVAKDSFGVFFNYVHMFNATTGYAMGDPTGGNWVLRKTTNSGESWFSPATLPANPTTEAGWNNSMMWFDNNNGWFGTNSSHVYRTTDGGTSWTATPTVFSGGQANSFAVQFNSLSIGLTGAQNGSLNLSTDAGATWALQTSTLATATLGMSGATGTQNFWVTAGNNISYSSNFGTSWSTAGPLGYNTGTAQMNHVNMVSIGSSVYGWAVGASGVTARFRLVPTGANDGVAALPTSFGLSQNYPNPFNPSTTIKYDLPEEATVTLKIYNLLGQEVFALVNGPQQAGYYESVWDGRNTTGASISSGVYFYRFEAIGQSGQTFSNLKKMLFLK